MFGLAGLPLAAWLVFLLVKIYLQLVVPPKPEKTREQLEAELAETRKQLEGVEEGVPTKPKLEPELEPEPEPQPQAYSKEVAP